MATPKMDAEFWVDELRDLSPEVKYLIWRGLSSGLEPKEFQRLTAEVEWDGDEEVNYATFRCPHCYFICDYSEITAVTYGLSTDGEFDDYDADEQNIEVTYGTLEDKLVAYECDNCHTPVNLPAGWKAT